MRSLRKEWTGITVQSLLLGAPNPTGFCSGDPPGCPGCCSDNAGCCGSTACCCGCMGVPIKD